MIRPLPLLAWLCFVLLLLVPRAWALEVPELKGRVNDYAGILSEQDRRRIEERLAAHERSSGQQFALLTVDSLEGDALESFSIRVVERWKLGKKGKDDGLLLLVVVRDRKMRIEVGYGLEGQITDALSSRVIRETLVPAFRQQDYAGGIDRAFVRLIRAAGGDPGAEPAPLPPERTVRRPKVNLGFIFFFIVLPLLLWLGNRGGGGRGGRRRPGFWTGLGAGYMAGSWGRSRGGFGGGGLGGGGGFSGGGGGFGGGGASGSW